MKPALSQAPELICSYARTNMHRPEDWKRPVSLQLDLGKPAVRIEDGRSAQAINVKVTPSTVTFTHGGRIYNYYYNLNRKTGALRMTTMRLFVDYRCRTKSATPT